jgi:hypothetical protein
MTHTLKNYEIDLILNETITPETIQQMKEDIETLTQQKDNLEDYYFKYRELKLKQREYVNKYRKTDKGKEKVKEAKKRYYTRQQIKKGKKPKEILSVNLNDIHAVNPWEI